MARTFTTVTVIALGVAATLITAASADDVFRSPKAADATVKYNGDVRRIDEEYRRKLADARKLYLAGLKEALRDAARATNPNADEIAKISAKIKDLESEATARNDEVAGKSFVFSAFEHRQGAQLTLQKDGQVAGKVSDAESAWRLEGGKLLFLNNEGTPTSILDRCIHDGQTWYCDWRSLRGETGQIHAVIPAPQASSRDGK